MTITGTCQAAVFSGVGLPIRIESFVLAGPPPGHILARVRMATICGSDLHTVSGRRVEPTPLILGHEVVAEVTALGEGIAESAAGKPLKEGDRISFTIMASCGKCANCQGGLPQKCESLFKYGHSSCAGELPLSGGLAQYMYLRPGTAVFHVPPEVPDTVACTANCALATVINGLEAICVLAGERVLVQGSGLLGLYCAALLRERGASEIVVTDIDHGRLEMAKRFGADRVLNVRGMSEEDMVAALGEGRFNCVVEVCGDPSAVWPGLRTLGLRGRYVIIGLVCAGANFTIDGNTVARNYLTIKGVHNYAPKHLAEGLAFLEATRSRFPYEALVSSVVPLSEVRRAFDLAAAKTGARVAVAPQQ